MSKQLVLNRRICLKDGTVCTLAERIERFAEKGIYSTSKIEIQYKQVRNGDTSNAVLCNGRYYNTKEAEVFVLNGYYCSKSEHEYSQGLKRKMNL